MIFKNGALQSTTILVLGSRKSGKSALINKFLFPREKLPELYQKTILKQTTQQRIFYSKFNEKIAAHPVIFNILECSEIALFGHSCIQADVFLLVYNVNDDKSWTFIKQIYEDVKLLGKPVVLCGMGLDLVTEESVLTHKHSNTINGGSSSTLVSRKISLAAVKSWADERNLSVFETSIQEPVKIESLFRKLATIPTKSNNQPTLVKPKSLFARMSMSVSRMSKSKISSSSNRSSLNLQNSTIPNTEREYQIDHPLLTSTAINTYPNPRFSKILNDRDIAWQKQYC